MSSAYTVPLFLRGEVIVDDLVSFGTRTGAAKFQAPDMARHVHRLPLPSPMAMADLYEVPFDEIDVRPNELGDRGITCHELTRGVDQRPRIVRLPVPRTR